MLPRREWNINMSYVEWAEEVAKKANRESCTVTTVIIELSKEIAKGKDEEKAKVDVANRILNGTSQ